MAGIAFEHVTKVYPGGITAVSDFHLEIAHGEFVVLLGPSGCGKSTVLRMVAGLEEITAGTIRIGDRIVNDLPPKDRDIAMVFQNYALYPHMTVRENLAFGLKLRKLPRSEIEKRVRAAAETLGLTALLERYPKELSGGQRQRVAVGRAIVRNPAVFLFDEPLSNLDAKMRVQMRVEISRLHQQLATTMIYVTHDQVEAMTMGERIVVLKDGRIQQVADPMTLYDRPVNRFVAGFIGTPPMNFLDGYIRRAEAEDGLVFEADGGIRLSIPLSRSQTLGAWLDRPVVMGLRPEDIGSAAAEQWPGAPRLRATVDLVEPMGAESYVYLRTGPFALVSRVDAHRAVRVGEGYEPAVIMDKAHFFDPTTEHRIG